jgi:hypothetical protein
MVKKKTVTRVFQIALLYKFPVKKEFRDSDSGT